MTARPLAVVGAHLDEVISGLLGECRSPADVYDYYEEMAIQILDSQFDDYPPGELQDYLEVFLATKRQELGIEALG